MISSVFPVLLLLPLLALAHPTPNQEGSDEVMKRALPGQWFHERGHPVERLFNRQGNPNDGVPYAAVGTPQWSQGYPAMLPPANQTPVEWLLALNQSIAAGKIPNIPVATLVTENPVYPTGANSSGPDICSATVGCREPSDIWDAPTGMLGVAFDDGPADVSAVHPYPLDGRPDLC